MENTNKLKKIKYAVNIAETVVIIIWIIAELCLEERIYALPSPWGWAIFFTIDVVWGSLIAINVILDKKIDNKPFHKNFGFYLCIMWVILLICEIMQLMLR